MAYIGRSVDIGMFEKQVLTADSSTTTFTLTFAVGSANSLMVVYGGVLQEPGVAYSVSGGGQSIVFSEAPVTGTTTYIIYLGKQLTTPRAAGQETTKQTLTGDGTTTLFTLTDPPVVPAGIMVFVDGILQREGSGNNYVSGGSTINFNGAPDSGAEIDVYTLVKEKVSIDTVADGSITRAKMASTFPYWDAQGNFGIGLPSSTILNAYRTEIDTGASSSASNPLALTARNTAGQVKRMYFQASVLDSTPVYTLATGAVGTDPAIAFAPSGSEAIRITNTGNFGIGTTAPSQKLEVAGNIYVNTSGNPYLQIKTSGAGNNPYIRMQADTNYWDIQSTFSNANDELFFMYNGSTKLSIDPTTGNIAQTGSVASSGVNLYIRNTTDTGGDNTRYAGIQFQIGSDIGTAAIQAYRTNSATDYSTALTFLTKGAGAPATNPTEKMRITAAGEVLIGYTNAGSGGKLVVNGITYQNQTANGTSGTPVVSGGYLIGPNDPNIYAGIRALNSYLSSNASQLAFYVTNTSGSAYEAGRFDKDGNLIAGGAGSGSLGRITTRADSGTPLAVANEAVSGTLVAFMGNGSGNRGSITHNGTTVAYNTSSDYRLKNTIVPMTDALAKVAQLKPVTYKWNSNNSNGEGFIAHELQTIVPECVTGEKDAVDSKGDPVYQGVDTSFLVATLTAAIQELKAIVDAQAVEIAALKAK